MLNKICVPKIIKFGGNLTKFWQKQFCTVFLGHRVCRRPLRSAGTSNLEVPLVKLTTVTNRAFPVVGPRTRNKDDVTSAAVCIS